MRHGVMNLYEPMALGQEGFPIPPGVTMPSGFPVDILGQVASALNLQSIGVYTPWAGRESDTEWRPVKQPPDTNITVSVLTDQALRTVPQVTFGSPLPFVAILTDGLPTETQLRNALGGTDYKPFQTQAVYRQDDRAPVPRIYFLHWAERRGPGEGQAGKSLEAGASSVGGRLVFAMQVDYGTTSMRQPPNVSFEQALNVQLGIREPPPNGMMPPVTPPTTPPVKKSGMPGWLAPAAVGTAVAFATYYFMRGRKK